MNLPEFVYLKTFQALKFIWTSTYLAINAFIRKKLCMFIDENKSTPYQHNAFFSMCYHQFIQSEYSKI